MSFVDICADRMELLSPKKTKKIIRVETSAESEDYTG